MPVSVQHDGMTITSTSDSAEAVKAGLEAADAAATPDQSPDGTPAPQREPVEAALPAETAPAPDTSAAADSEPPYARADDGTFKSKAKKGSLQWRIDQKSWEAGEARRQAQQERTERERLSARLAELESQRAAKPETPAAAPAPDGKPVLESFETYEAYVEAIADWKADQKFKARDAEQQRTTAAQQVLDQRQQFHGRQEQYAGTVADYWEVVHTNANRALSPVMTQAILASEHGPAIIYHLSTHPDVVDQLTRETQGVSVDAAPLMRQLLENLVSAPPASRPAQASAVVRPSVPTPIKPVGSGLSVAETPPDDLPFGKRYVDEMNRKELAQQKALGR